MKKIKDENKILIMLAFFSISIGLWGNFRQLWLQDNNFSVTQISNIISIGTFISVLGIALIGKYVTLNKLKSTLTFILIIKFINMLVLYYLNGKGQTELINLTIVIDIIMEYIIITSIYPLITTIVKSDTIYSKRKLTEYLFRDIGILFGGIFIGKSIAGILVNYNTCLIISNIFLVISIITMMNIKINHTEERQKKKDSMFKYILKSKILSLYLLDMFIGTIAMSTALGLKMLTLTNYFAFSDSIATNYLLIVGLIADGIGILALKYLTPKNDYLTITIKFGIRFMGYVIAFISNNIMITLIAITWSLLISTAYENICDGVYINRVENDHQLTFANIRYIIRFLGEAIGVFFCGIMYEMGLKYMFGLSSIFMIFQIGLAYYLIHLRKGEKYKMSKRITLISFIEKISEVEQLMNNINENTCKVPYGINDEKRYEIDNLPYHKEGAKTMTNGERIKYLREKNGLTQKDVAVKLGVEPAAISKYELDMREPNIEAIKKLATIFNVSIDYLLGRTSDVLVSEADKDMIEIPILKKKYDLMKKRIDKLKEEYKNENAIIIAKNELCTGTGRTTYGESQSNPIISIKEIENLLSDFEHSKFPKPQILLKLKDIKNGIIIVEIDSFDDEEMPINATERLSLYITKLSKEYNVLGLAMSIDKDENCKLIDSVYQKQGESYYIQLHLPKTVLTVGEYIDIMSRM